MPITPFHFGPGAMIKLIAPRHFSFTVFAFSQVLIDLEPIGFFLFTGDPIHPYLHTALGAGLVFVVSWLAVPIETLQWLCVLAGVIGVTGLALWRWRAVR